MLEKWRQRLIRLLTRLGLLRPGKIMDIGGSDTLPPPLSREAEAKLLERIEEEVRTAAYKIIEAKKATYYGIGMAMARITRALLGDEHSVLTVSARLDGQYGQRDVFAGVPCVLCRDGVKQVVELALTQEEKARFADSCRTLQESWQGLEG